MCQENSAAIEQNRRSLAVMYEQCGRNVFELIRRVSESLAVENEVFEHDPELRSLKLSHRKGVAI